MAYYIFLKSLRSLEEFRKNPHVKIHLNLLLQISQALVNSKSNFYSKRNLPPNSAHSAQPACPLPRPWPADRPKPSNPPRPEPPSPLGLSATRPAHAFSVFYRRRFPLWFTPSRDGHLPLVSLTTGPRLSASSPPPAARARLRCHRFPITERRSAPRLGCPRTITTSPSFPLP
jgi:hypothetical protein